MPGKQSRRRTPASQKFGTAERPIEGRAGGSKRRRVLAPGETERVAVWLTRDLARRLRVYAAEHRMALSVVVEDAIADHLDEGSRT